MFTRSFPWSQEEHSYYGRYFHYSRGGIQPETYDRRHRATNVAEACAAANREDDGFAFFLFGQFLAAFGAPRPHTKPISITAVQQLKAPLTLEAVERAFGTATGQPGPRRALQPSTDEK